MTGLVRRVVRAGGGEPPGRAARGPAGRWEVVGKLAGGLAW